MDLEPASLNIFDLTCSVENIKEQVNCASALRRTSSIKARRAKSEIQLESILPGVIEPGESWHVISQGDIDSLSFISRIIKNEPLEYLLFSTWCMAGEDVDKLDSWVNDGRIGRLDCYVGEIFPSQYSAVHAMLCLVARKTAGRVCVFRNHAKIYAGTSARMKFAIESSANINTNPRCEQTSIHADADLFFFYKNFFDGIRSFTRDFDTWSPYEFMGQS